MHDIAVLAPLHAVVFMMWHDSYLSVGCAIVCSHLCLTEIDYNERPEKKKVSMAREKK